MRMINAVITPLYYLQNGIAQLTNFRNFRFFKGILDTIRNKLMLKELKKYNFQFN
jgi:hypothetical protein